MGSARESIAYVGLGSNLGDPERQLGEALRRLSAIGTLDGLSSVWRTEPVGFADQPDYLNVVARLRTTSQPLELLDSLQAIERDIGRERPFRNGPRTIDLDLLFYDDVQLSTQRLTVPHPRVLERGFTLRPLAELAPELRHPDTGRSVADHLAAAEPLEAGEPLFSGSRLLGPVGSAADAARRHRSGG